MELAAGTAGTSGGEEGLDGGGIQREPALGSGSALRSCFSSGALI